MAVLELPPRFSRSSHVRTESRYGMKSDFFFFLLAYLKRNECDSKTVESMYCTVSHWDLCVIFWSCNQFHLIYKQKESKRHRKWESIAVAVYHLGIKMIYLKISIKVFTIVNSITILMIKLTIFGAFYVINEKMVVRLVFILICYINILDCVYVPEQSRHFQNM